MRKLLVSTSRFGSGEFSKPCSLLNTLKVRNSKGYAISNIKTIHSLEEVASCGKILASS